MKKTILITVALTTLMLNSISNIAKAEENYNYKNAVHKEDMVCIASLSIGRDIMFAKDKEVYLALTDLQNQFYLKYNSSSQLGNHIDARKILIKQSWTVEQLSDKVVECKGRI